MCIRSLFPTWQWKLLFGHSSPGSGLKIIDATFWGNFSTERLFESLQMLQLFSLFTSKVWLPCKAVNMNTVSDDRNLFPPVSRRRLDFYACRRSARCFVLVKCLLLCDKLWFVISSNNITCSHFTFTSAKV